MKIAISNIAWEQKDEPAVADLMAELGIEGVEIAPTKIWQRPLEAREEEILAYRQFWGDRGIGIVAMQALLFGRADLQLFTSEAVRQETLAYLDGISRIGGRLGAGPLVFGSPRNRDVGELPAEQVEDVGTRFFREAGRNAHRVGTTLVIEPNPREYACTYVTDSRQGLALVTGVDQPGFGLHLDTAGMTLAGEDPAEGIGRCKGAIEHFHASEPYLAPLGSGGVDQSAFAAALREIGYENWVSIEMRPVEGVDTVTEIRRVLTLAHDIYG